MKRAKTSPELVTNAAGRDVPVLVNGKKQQPYVGIEGAPAKGRKAAPPIPSASDYPNNGDKRVPDLETALRKCGLRDGMVLSNHHHLRNGEGRLRALRQAQAEVRREHPDLYAWAGFICQGDTGPLF